VAAWASPRKIPRAVPDLLDAQAVLALEDDHAPDAVDVVEVEQQIVFGSPSQEPAGIGRVSGSWSVRYTSSATCLSVADGAAVNGTYRIV
jgi:hypothetical protein